MPKPIYGELHKHIETFWLIWAENQYTDFYIR